MPLLGPDGKPVEPTMVPATPRNVRIDPDQPSSVSEAIEYEVHHPDEPKPEGLVDQHDVLLARMQTEHDPVLAVQWVIAEGIHPKTFPRDGTCMCHLRARDVLRTLGEYQAAVVLPDGTTVLDIVAEQEALVSEVLQHSVVGIPGPEDSPVTAAMRLLAHYRVLTPEYAAQQAALAEHRARMDTFDPSEIAAREDAEILHPAALNLGRIEREAQDRAVAFGVADEVAPPVVHPDGSVDI